MNQDRGLEFLDNRLGTAGTVEGLNNKAKRTTSKAYGFRTEKSIAMLRLR
ncbi:MAG: transposase [Planctomycetota bacterium]